MTREGAIGNLIHAIRWNDMPKKEALEMAIEALEQKPSNDTVSCGVFEQAMWERDVAITQLKELGYGLGEKPKTGHWIEKYGEDSCGERYSCWVCSECGRDVGFNLANIEDVLSEYPFCHCGAKMYEPQKGANNGSNENDTL